MVMKNYHKLCSWSPEFTLADWQCSSLNLSSLHHCDYNYTAGGMIIAGKTHQITNPQGPRALLGISGPLSTMWHCLPSARRHLKYHLLSLRGLFQFDPHWTYSHFPAASDPLSEDTHNLPVGWSDQRRPWLYFITLYAKSCMSYQMGPSEKKMYSGRAVVTEKYSELNLSWLSHYRIWQIAPIWRHPYISKYYELEVWHRKLDVFLGSQHSKDKPRDPGLY